MTTTLNPAKPYEYQSQHQALGVAMRKLARDVLPLSRSDDRWAKTLAYGIDKSYKHADGLGFDVARLHLTVRTHSHGSIAAPASAISAQRRVADKVVEQLRAAGWTVEAAGGYAGRDDKDDRWFLVYGPGFDELVIQRRADKVAEAERTAQRQAQQEADNEAIVALLDRHGVAVRSGQMYRQDGTVTLTLEQLAAFERSAMGARL